MTDAEARAKLAANLCPKCGGQVIRRNDPSPLGGDWVAVWFRCAGGHPFEVIYSPEKKDYVPVWPGWGG